MRCEERQRSARREVLFRPTARMQSCCLLLGLFSTSRQAAAQAPFPGVVEASLDRADVLAPGASYPIKVGVSQAKFVRFNCMGGPADVVVTMSTYSEHADPLLFLSVNPDRVPSFSGHDASSFSHWREDSIGDHYATAKGVGPRGGIAGILNLRKFASEELDAVLTLHCSTIIAFDTIFWDHLRTSAVCPVGSDEERDEAKSVVADRRWGRRPMDPTKPSPFCSGHGTCENFGECTCDSEHTGPACEHSKLDIVVGQDRNFQVAAGHYQYFRVHIPPHFVGGYVEVKVRTSEPAIVLIRNDDLPTKNDYELSNFDDWINHRNRTDIKFKVLSSDGINGPGFDLSHPPPFDDGSRYGYADRPPSFGDGMPEDNLDRIGGGVGMGPEGAMPGVPEMGYPPPGLGRRLQEQMGRAAEASNWPDFFQRMAGAKANVSSSPRQLQLAEQAVCPKRMIPALSHPLCNSQSFLQCKESCLSCMHCVQNSDDKQACSADCQQCINPRCTRHLAACASDISCAGPVAHRCEMNCGNCITCFKSKSAACSLCQCCDMCLPLSAKCMGNPGAESRYAFVGIYHHRRYADKRHDVMQATVDISLTADEQFVHTHQVAPSWTADLYNSFHDLRTLEIADSQVYPNGEQFMYDLEIKHAETAHLEVRTYRDRLTLLHLKNVHQLAHMELSFISGTLISHVLTASRAAPKTLFDFDDAPHVVLPDPLEKAAIRLVVIHARHRQNIWCAIFGKQDGVVQIQAKASGPVAGDEGDVGSGLNSSLVLICLSVCGVLVWSQMSGKLGGPDAGSISERLFNMVKNRGGHESTASLTRVGSLQGYSGSDVIDRNVEDQYLHRGGLGDEGL